MDTTMELKEMLEDEIKFQQERMRRAERRARREMAEKEAKTSFLLGCFSTITVVAIAAAMVFILISSASIKDPDFVVPAVEPIPVKQADTIILVDDSASKQDVQVVIQNDEKTTVVTVETEYAIPFTEEDRELLEKILAAESFSFWSEQDIISLGTVIMNRVEDPHFPNTIHEVLTQDLQFATYANGRYKEAVVTDECREAVDAILRGERNLNSDVLWFCTKEYYGTASEDDFFKSLDHVYTCRNVCFFEEGK